MARYDIVPERSQVLIEATSNVHPINSRTDGFEGFVELEVGDGGHVDLDVPRRRESCRLPRRATVVGQRPRGSRAAAARRHAAASRRSTVASPRCTTPAATTATSCAAT